MGNAQAANRLADEPLKWRNICESCESNLYFHEIDRSTKNLPRRYKVERNAIQVIKGKTWTTRKWKSES